MCIRDRDKAWQQDEVQQNALPRLTEVAELAEEASQTLNETDNAELIVKARTLLEQREMPEGRVRIFYRSCLHMLILICHTYPATKKQNLQWFGVDWQETWLKFRRRISRHSIETRFALRLSVVLTISCEMCIRDRSCNDCPCCQHRIMSQLGLCAVGTFPVNMHIHLSLIHIYK